MTEFKSFWRNHYGECPPLGHRLRDAFVDRWVRFHSLPESKRYAVYCRDVYCRDVYCRNSISISGSNYTRDWLKCHEWPRGLGL